MTSTTTHDITPMQRDEAAAAAIRRHHEHLVTELGQLVEALRTPDGADEGADDGATAKAQLVTWARTALAPHAAGEETTFYRSAAELEAGRLLIAGMVAEHQVILGIVAAIDASTEPAATAAWAEALLRVFTSHAAKENDLVLPLLVSDPSTNLAELLEQMHHDAH
ncbi:hemerythrin domain-containing protein [Intrasporangium sp. DVR]|uniref:hemerythrin domain-containing protein n=1 Tax=Intrasporangium sp. DVR TaxID=3127867 RepID=UPI00313A5964